MAAWIDSHTHLESFARKGELEGVFERARKAGVGAMVAVGTCPADWAVYRKIAQQENGYVAYTVGLHPCNVSSDWRKDVAALADCVQASPPPAGIGEIGLDRFHLSSDPKEAASQYEQQEEAFRAQLAFAIEVDQPVVIHSRGAFDDCLRCVEESGIEGRKVVFHCFSEGAAAVRRLNALDARASFTGIITYKNAEEVRAAALEQGLDRLMLETDAPYLAPVPHRGKANEPAFLQDIAQFTARLFSVDIEELKERTSAATKEFYGLV